MAMGGWARNALGAVHILLEFLHKFFTFLFTEGTVFLIVLTLNIDERRSVPFCN